MPYLRVEEGPEKGRLYELTPGEWVLGRDRACHCQLLDEMASRQHARIVVAESGCRIEDLGSVNGVRLNGASVRNSPVSAGDRIQIGETLLSFGSGEYAEKKTVVVGSDSGEKLSVVSVVEAVAGGVRIREGEKPGEHLKRLETLFEAVRSCREVDDLSVFGRNLFEVLAGGIGAHRGHLSFFVVEEEVLFEKTFCVLSAETDRVVLSESLQEEVLRERRAILLENEAQSGDRISMVREGIRCALAVPVLKDNDLHGLIYLDRQGSGPSFHLEDLEWVVSLVDQLAPVLSLILERASFQDIEERRSLVGSSVSFQKMMDQVSRVAHSRTSVLLVGETGTGKELVARSIHRRGELSGSPFVAINCGAIPPELMESELFGHVEGAFTGAVSDRRGVFCQANGGTLFLDEVAEIPLNLQPKLLRVLEERSFRPVGAEENIQVEVRVIAATAASLDALISDGKFRQDLFYRIAVVELPVPPLRERKGDLAILIETLLARLARGLGREIPRITDSACQALSNYSWPGNVRELRNVLERALVFSEGGVIDREDLPDDLFTGRQQVERLETRGRLLTLKESEELAIRRALSFTGGKKGEAVRILGTTWPTLNKKIKEYEIDVSAF